MKTKISNLLLVTLICAGTHCLAADDTVPASSDQATTPSAAQTAQEPTPDTPTALASPTPSAEAATDDSIGALALNVAQADTPSADQPAALAAADLVAADVTRTNAPADPAQEAGLINIPEAPLTDVISTLARQAGINFQFDPRVTANTGPDGKPVPQATVSIRWDNVTAYQALEALLNNHGLVMVQDAKTQIARITIKDPAAPDPLFTRVIQLKYASPTNMAAVLQPTLSTRSKVLTDNRTSKLVLVATEQEFESVDTLLAELDLPPKQVLIEARLLETSKSPSSIKGIDWSGTLKAQNVSFGNGKTVGTTTTTVPGAAATTTTTLPSGRTVTSTSGSGSSSQTTLTTALGNAGLGLNTAKGFFPATAFLNADGVNAVLSFLNSDTDTEVVATPRTVTLDNQTARLEITRAFPIFMTTPGTAQTPAGSQVTYTNLGTILSVTPRISANSNIHLRVIPEVSNKDGTDTQVSNGQNNTANIYAIRKVETQVVIPNGHTLVMGGLISDASTRTRSKVPILGDIPGIGMAFRHDAKQRTKSNLIMFITPTIVEDADFQATQTSFLKNKVQDKVDRAETPMDSVEPFDWNKRRDQ